MSLPTATTQNAVITSLVDGLIGLAALDDAHVNSAPIDLSQATADQVAVLNIPDGNEVWNGLGNRKRDETYTIEMAALAIRESDPGDFETTIREVRDRVYALYAAVEGYVRGNPHHGGVTIKQLSGASLTQGYQAQARWARLDWGVRVTAQIEVA